MAEYIPQLKQIGVQSLKIEGRLRQPDYVESAVSAYRLLLDAPEKDFPEAQGEARALLARTCGRKWSTGFATKESMKDLVKADSVGAAGMRIGGVEEIRENGFGRDNIPAMMAAVVAVCVPLMILFLIFRRQIMSGVARGGMKG